MFAVPAYFAGRYVVTEVFISTDNKECRDVCLKWVASLFLFCQGFCFSSPWHDCPTCWRTLWVIQRWFMALPRLPQPHLLRGGKDGEHRVQACVRVRAFSPLWCLEVGSRNVCSACVPGARRCLHFNRWRRLGLFLLAPSTLRAWIRYKYTTHNCLVRQIIPSVKKSVDCVKTSAVIKACCHWWHVTHELLHFLRV